MVILRAALLLCLFLGAVAALPLPLRADDNDFNPGIATPNEILAQAHRCADRGDYALAIDLINRFLRIPGVERPALAEGVFLRAKIAQKIDEPTAALVWYRRYLSEFPDQIDAPRAMFQSGELYKQLGAYDRAREAYYKTLSFAINKASSLEKDDFSSSLRLSQAATWELAETEYLAANWERADELYERFKKQNPSLDKLIQTSNFRQADIAFQLHKTDAAISKYENALSIAPFHPFAAESWLRLVTLYGQTKQKDKQNAALQSFIWLVNTLEKDDQLYWQRRCADQLLTEYKGNLLDQTDLLETILKNKDNPAWAKMLDFYLSLLDRQAADPSGNIPRPSSAANDDWNKWLTNFRGRLGGIIQQIETMRNTDNSGPAPAPSPAVSAPALTATK